MPALVIDSVTIPVRAETGFEDEELDLAESGRSADGYLRSGIVEAADRAAVFALDTGWMLTAAGETIEAHLALMGRRTASGDLFGGSRTVYVRNLSREDHPAGTLVALRCELHEALPAQEDP